MSREIALNILIDYYKNKSYLNILIDNAFHRYQLSDSDKRFITHVVYGTVQNMIYLNALLAPCIKNKRLHVYERMLLLMSLYQHHFMDRVPDYAIVNEAVQLAKTQKGTKTANFINAVLKKALTSELKLDDYSEEERISLTTSHPLWLVKMLSSQYGIDTCQAICLSNNEASKASALVNTLKTSREEILKNPQFKPSILSKQGVIYESGNIALSEEYHRGYVNIQDESSQLVGYLLNPQKDEKVLDMCCAPGGKTMHLAMLMENKGEIIADDIHLHKLDKVQENARRLGITNIKTVCHDALTLDEIYGCESFDCLLLDGPCSGLGDLRRKPEIRYNDSRGIDDLKILQKNLLEKAYFLLKKGGRMVYSTCTINKNENERQIEGFLLKHQDLVKVQERTILPMDYDSDGFYMCLLKKG